jgi:hypothetical protein
MIDANFASFDGWAASSGIDPMGIPADRLLNLAYWWATRNAEDENAIRKFDARLWQPPVGEAPAPGSVWDPEIENAALGALATALGTG